MIGGIISGVGKVGAAIAGGIAGRRAARRNKKLLRKLERENQEWYDKEYNADFTQRADAQASLNAARKILDERYARAKGAAAVSGATDESVALEKKAANETLADVTSSIASRADAYKEQVRSNYDATRTDIAQQRMGVNNQQAQNVQSAANQISDAAATLGSAISSPLKK